MKERQSLVRVTAVRYQRAGKREKRVILDEFVAACGYHRTYASYLLSRHGRRVEAGPKRVFVGDVGKRIRKKREPTYGDEERAALKKIWAIMDMICGKRLAAVLPELIPKLEHWGELDVSWEVREKLLRMSRSTIDRLLAGERKKIELKRKSGTKPGTLLKHQIPIRTFSDWDDASPGFVEIDLVAHGGGDPSGDLRPDALADRCRQRMERGTSRQEQGPGLGIRGTEGHSGPITLLFAWT